MVSHSKSKLICGEALDLEALEGILEDDRQPADLIEDPNMLTAINSNRRMLQYMLDSSKCFRELEMLSIALNSMDEYAAIVELFEG